MSGEEDVLAFEGECLECGTRIRATTPRPEAGTRAVIRVTCGGCGAWTVEEIIAL